MLLVSKAFTILRNGKLYYKKLHLKSVNSYFIKFDAKTTNVIHKK